MKINIQNKLKEKGMTRYELAKRIGVTYPTIDNIYKGDSTSIKFEVLESLCRELDCSLDEILIFDDNNLKDRQKKYLLAYYNLLNKMNSKDNKSDTE